MTTKGALAITLKNINRLGFNVEESYGRFELIQKKKKKRFKWDSDTEVVNEISVNTETLPNCCGVDEIGELSIDHYTMSDKNLRQATIFLVHYVFLYYLNERLPGRIGKPRVGKTIIFNSNGVGDCKFFEEAMNTVPGDAFICVSNHTKNGRNGNWISMYIGQ